jgi:hypothetical protein
MASITFPYANFDQALQDQFKKLGGKDEAFRYMSNGYKQNLWRKDSNERRQDRVKQAMELLKRHEASVGTKAERQLDRK